jgi:hypothetical protein
VVAAGVTLEQTLHLVFQPVLGPASGIVAAVCAAIVYVFVARAACSLVEDLDLVGARRHRALRLELAEVASKRELDNKKLEARLKLAFGDAHRGARVRSL